MKIKEKRAEDLLFACRNVLRFVCDRSSMRDVLRRFIPLGDRIQCFRAPCVMYIRDQRSIDASAQLQRDSLPYFQDDK